MVTPLARSSVFVLVVIIMVIIFMALLFFEFRPPGLRNVGCEWSDDSFILEGNVNPKSHDEGRYSPSYCLTFSGNPCAILFTGEEGKRRRHRI